MPVSEEQVRNFIHNPCKEVRTSANETTRFHFSSTAQLRIEVARLVQTIKELNTEVKKMADRGNVIGVIAIVKHQLGTQYDCVISDISATRVACEAGYMTVTRGRYGGRKTTRKGELLVQTSGELAEIATLNVNL